MKFDKEKIQAAISDIRSVRQTPYFQSNIYNSLKLSENVLEEILVAMKNKEESLEFSVEVIMKGEEDDGTETD